MRILLLNQYLPPDRSASAAIASDIAHALAQRHLVTAVAGRPSYEPIERPPRYLWRREACGSLIVERVGSTAFSRRRTWHRLSNYFTYLALAMARAVAVRTDLILAMTDPPVVGIGGALVAWMRRLPFVYSVQDIYPDMAIEAGWLQPRGWTDWWERLHCWALRRAAYVIVLGDDMRERILAKGVDPTKVVVVRSGAALPKASPSPGHPTTRQIRGQCRFVLLHAGNIGFAGAWDALLQAARELERDGVGLVFVGTGAQQEKVQKLANGCAAVRFLPFQPVEEMPYVMAAADLHVVTVRRGLEGIVVPSKLYAILAAGRPVLAVAPEESDVTRIVRRNGCGVVANPDDPASIVAAVREVRDNPDRLKSMGERAREAAPEFERDGQVRRFADVIEGISGEMSRNGTGKMCW